MKAHGAKDSSPIDRVNESISAFIELLGRPEATKNQFSLAAAETVRSWLHTALSLDRAGLLDEEQAALLSDAMRQLNSLVQFELLPTSKGNGFTC